MDFTIFNTVTSINTIAELNALFLNYDANPFFSGTNDYLLRQRFDEKYIEFYLNMPEESRPKWHGKLITGNIAPLEIDMHKTEMIISYQGFKYSATVSNGLKFTQPAISPDVQKVFDRYIVNEVGNACRGIFLYDTYPTVTTVF